MSSEIVLTQYGFFVLLCIRVLCFFISVGISLYCILSVDFLLNFIVTNNTISSICTYAFIYLLTQISYTNIYDIFIYITLLILMIHFLYIYIFLYLYVSI